MSLQLRINALATAIGADVKALKTAQGELSGLTTTSKANLVAAINELAGLIGSASGIDDNAGNGNTAATWSADKIFDTIEAAKAAVKNDILGGAGAALDTLAELATALGNDASFATTIASQIAARVRFDEAQVLTAPQKVFARDNIGAASDADLTALTTALGTLETDFAGAYAAAKA